MTTPTSEKVAVEPACPKACNSCPWRLANQGSKPDPHKFYTSKNLARLWRALREGARMSCHPTDPRMAEFAGYEAIAERDTAHECTGSLILIQREWMRFQEMVNADPEAKDTLRRYRRQYPNGLTRSGLITLVERAAFGGTVLNLVTMSRPDLSDEDVGYPPIAKKGRHDVET